MRCSILDSNKIFFSFPKRRDKLWGSPRIVGVERVTAEVKNEWSYILTVPLRPHVERNNFTLCVLIISYWKISARYMTMLLHGCHSRYFLFPFAVLGPSPELRY